MSTNTGEENKAAVVASLAAACEENKAAVGASPQPRLLRSNAITLGLVAMEPHPLAMMAAQAAMPAQRPSAEEAGTAKAVKAVVTPQKRRMIKTSSIWIEDKRKIPPVFLDCSRAIHVVKMEHKKTQRDSVLLWWRATKHQRRRDALLQRLAQEKDEKDFDLSTDELKDLIDMCQAGIPFEWPESIPSMCAASELLNEWVEDDLMAANSSNAAAAGA